MNNKWIPVNDEIYLKLKKRKCYKISSHLLQLFGLLDFEIGGQNNRDITSFWTATISDSTIISICHSQQQKDVFTLKFTNIVKPRQTLRLNNLYVLSTGVSLKHLTHSLIRAPFTERIWLDERKFNYPERPVTTHGYKHSNKAEYSQLVALSRPAPDRSY